FDDDRSDLDALATVARLQLGLGRLKEASEVATRIATQDAEAGAITTAEIDFAAGARDQGEPTSVKDIAQIPDTSERFAVARRIAGSALINAQLPKRALELLEPAR